LAIESSWLTYRGDLTTHFGSNNKHFGLEMKKGTNNKLWQQQQTLWPGNEKGN